MEEKNKAIVGSIVFIILILTLAIGGYIYAFKSDNHQTDKELQEKKIMENKKDTSKDFIYYDNLVELSNTLGITYKDAIINLNNTQAFAINSELKSEREEYYNTVKKISETTNDTGNEILYDTDDIYSATIRDYQNYIFDNYISLVVSDSLYDCFKGVYDYTKIKSYIFDVDANERVSNIDILNKYDTNISEVKERIKKKLESDQTVSEEGIESIKIDETIENLSNDNSYGLYVDDDGNLIIKYIVKSNNLNYNESMIIN